MKKSEIYHLAQIAVVLSPAITPETKIEVLRELWNREELETFCEEQEAKKRGDGNAETV